MWHTVTGQKYDGGASLDGVPAGKGIGPVPLHRHKYVQKKQRSYATGLGGGVYSVRYYSDTILHRREFSGTDR